MCFTKVLVCQADLIRWTSGLRGWQVGQPHKRRRAFEKTGEVGHIKDKRLASEDVSLPLSQGVFLLWSSKTKLGLFELCGLWTILTAFLLQTRIVGASYQLKLTLLTRTWFQCQASLPVLRRKSECNFLAEYLLKKKVVSICPGGPSHQLWAEAPSWTGCRTVAPETSSWWKTMSSSPVLPGCLERTLDQCLPFHMEAPLRTVAWRCFNVWDRPECLSHLAGCAGSKSCS